MRVWDDAEITTYLRSSTLVSPADFALLQDAHIVEQSDLFRLLIVYERGGLYVDLDRLANQRLTTLIDVNRLILPLYRLSDFAQDLVGGAPGSLLHRHAIQLNLQRREELLPPPN